MKVVFTKQFEREIRKIKDKKLAKEIEDIILEVKNTSGIWSLANFKKLTGHKYAYRFRTGN